MHLLTPAYSSEHYVLFKLNEQYKIYSLDLILLLSGWPLCPLREDISALQLWVVS